MLLLGLTGSIATGKSTVSRILSQPPYSIPIIDADILARRVVDPGTAGYRAILSHFSSTTPDLLQPVSLSLPEDGVDGKGRPLDRAALGRRIFGDEEERRKDRKVLNGIVHPAVRKTMLKAVLYYYVRGYWCVVLDIPLLFESRLDVFCGTVMVVAVRDPEVQMRRLRERDPHLSAEEASNRVRSQEDVREKAKRVVARGDGRGIVVWNDGPKEGLEVELRRAILKLKDESPRWWSLWLLISPLMGGLVGIWNMMMSWSARRDWERGLGREKAKL